MRKKRNIPETHNSNEFWFFYFFFFEKELKIIYKHLLIIILKLAVCCFIVIIVVVVVVLIHTMCRYSFMIIITLRFVLWLNIFFCFQFYFNSLVIVCNAAYSIIVDSVVCRFFFLFLFFCCCSCSCSC